MNDSEKQAKEVIAALSSYAERIREIQDVACGKETITRDERENLQTLLTKLKMTLNREQDQGDIEGRS